MDTIIYIYRWKVPEEQNLYLREDYDFQDYQLIRIAMSERLLQICAENVMGLKARRTKESGGFFERKRRKRRREEERLLLAEFLRDIGADGDNVRFVCEEPVAYFAGREFNGYFQAKYVRHLLCYAGFGDAYLEERKEEASMRLRRRDSEGRLHHFIILGQTSCVQELVYELVGSMKSLKWILPRRLYRQEQQDFVDILYEEYGLAVEVKLFEEEDSFTKAYPACRMPSIVLDFSETDRVPAMDVARDSIWLDMGASEEKRRRIEDRNTGIHYFSLKKEWKQPQKALNYLDTTSKNGYNT